MHRKHERGAQISRFVTIVLIAGCVTFLFAKNAHKSSAAKTSSAEYDQKIEEKNAVLDSIKEELEKGREKLQQLKTQEGTVVTQIDVLEKNIQTSEQYLRKVSVKIDSTSRSIAILTDQLSSANSELLLRQAIMKKRLRAMYKTGRIQLPHIILSSRNISDILHQVHYFNDLTNYDKRLAAHIDTMRMKIASAKSDLERQQRRLAAFKRNKQTEYVSLVDEQDSHQKLLQSVRAQKESYVKMIRELEAAQKELQNIVAMLEKNKRKKVRTQHEKSLNATFEKQKGRLPWPVSGKVVTDFGKVVHSIYKTVTMNTGIDISCHKGDKVICVAAGTVAYTGWMRGLGKLVILDHGGYYTTYARLEDVSVDNGENVEAGAEIGTVGEANQFDGLKLHFEIRRSTEAVDPLDWLDEKKR